MAIKLLYVGVAACLYVLSGAAYSAGNGPSDRPAPARPKASAASPAFSNLSYSTCGARVSTSGTLTLIGTTDDGGGMDTVYLTLWDDSVQQDVQIIQVQVT